MLEAKKRANAQELSQSSQPYAEQDGTAANLMCFMICLLLSDENHRSWNISMCHNNGLVSSLRRFTNSKEFHRLRLCMCQMRKVGLSSGSSADTQTPRLKCTAGADRSLSGTPAEYLSIHEPTTVHILCCKNLTYFCSFWFYATLFTETFGGNLCSL